MALTPLGRNKFIFVLMRLPYYIPSVLSIQNIGTTGVNTDKCIQLNGKHGTDTKYKQGLENTDGSLQSLSDQVSTSILFNISLYCSLKKMPRIQWA